MFEILVHKILDCSVQCTYPCYGADIIWLKAKLHLLKGLAWLSLLMHMKGQRSQSLIFLVEMFINIAFHQETFKASSRFVPKLQSTFFS